jgi:hypothetical protein
MARNVPDGIFGMTFHPQVIGRGGRMQILEDMIEHAKALDGVRFSTVRDAVRGWASANPFQG